MSYFRLTVASTAAPSRFAARAVPLMVCACLAIATGSARASSDLLATPIVHQAGDSPLGVATGNLDGDLYPDVVVANVGSSDLSLFLNQGDGTLAPEVRVTLDETPRHVDLGDVDGDGDDDIAVAHQPPSHLLSLLLNTGDGTFAEPLPYGSISPGSPDAVEILHLNDDAFPDVVVAAAQGRTLFVFLGTEDGLEDATEYQIDSQDSYPSDLAAIDLDDDEDVDLVVTATLTPSPPQVFRNLGDGTFGEGEPISDVLATEVSVAPGDMDRDGDPDLVVLDFAFRDVRIYPNDGSAGFGESTDFPVGPADLGSRVRVADMNRDLWPDVVRTAGFQSVVGVLLNDGGTLGPEAIFDAGGTSSSLELADLDLDGDPDVVVTNSSSNGTLSVLINNAPSSTHVDEAAGPRRPEFHLLGAAPNPFTSETSISFELYSPRVVRLEVYDVTGRRVAQLADREMGAGLHAFDWRGSDAVAGVYWIRLSGARQEMSTRVVKLD